MPLTGLEALSSSVSNGWLSSCAKILRQRDRHRVIYGGSYPEDREWQGKRKARPSGYATPAWKIRSMRHWGIDLEWLAKAEFVNTAYFRFFHGCRQKFRETRPIDISNPLYRGVTRILRSTFPIGNLVRSRDSPRVAGFSTLYTSD